jgi:hypothetical protein
MVKWSAIQTLLEDDPSDVLILLDCCASGTANACEGVGVNELISACAWNETANGVGPYSFTSALVIELRRLSQKTLFSVGELYRNIFWRTQSRMPEDVRQEGRERERHPAPIHLVLTQDAIPRSIQLSVRQERSQIAMDKTRTETNADENQMGSIIGESLFFPRGTTTSRHPTEDDYIPEPAVQQSRKQALIDKSKVPRLAFAIRLRDTFTPGEDIKGLFLQWLRDMPTIAEEVKVEAGFDAFSTLVIVSLPVAFCAYLSRDPAIISLGPIISGNRVSADIGSLVANPLLDPLSRTLSPSLQPVNTQLHPEISSGGSGLRLVVPEISKSEPGKGKILEICGEQSEYPFMPFPSSTITSDKTALQSFSTNTTISLTPIATRNPLQTLGGEAVAQYEFTQTGLKFMGNVKGTKIMVTQVTSKTSQYTSEYHQARDKEHHQSQGQGKQDKGFINQSGVQFCQSVTDSEIEVNQSGGEEDFYAIRQDAIEVEGDAIGGSFITHQRVW